jgi:O-antigen/teichoic acid export membrane protein
LNLLIVLSLPMTVGVILLAAPLCHALYGPHKFTQLPLALQYTALTILPLYIVSTMYQFLVAQNRNAIWTFFMIGTALVYAASSWMLIPMTLRVFHNGIVGAVMGTVIAEGASALCALVLLKANPFNRESVNTVVRALFATAVMGLAVWFTREALHSAPPLLTLVAGAGVGTTIFLTATFLLHILPAEQEQRLRALIASKLSRKASS